jgi:hypothetical protein
VFKRRTDGAVEIWEGTEDPQLLSITPANEWASTVASLTTEGETGLTFGLMMTLHNGGTAFDPEAHRHHVDDCKCGAEHVDPI